MTSILSKLTGLNKAINTTAKVEMTDHQVLQCKEALKRDNRGPTVNPNRFDYAIPYRVSVNYSNKWYNFGNFASADVAAAVGTIVSVAFFGDKAVAGAYDETLVEGAEEFNDWLADKRNADVIAKANGEQPSVRDGGALEETTNNVDTGKNPF